MLPPPYLIGGCIIPPYAQKICILRRLRYNVASNIHITFFIYNKEKQMPDYRVTLSYKDSQEGTTRKSFTGTFADAATASAAVDALVADLQAISDSQIYQTELTEVALIAGAPNAGSSVFEVVSATVDLTGKSQKANIQLPSPVDAIMAGNALDKDAALWTAAMANLEVGAGWTISDGDTYASTVKGVRAYRASGETNLP